MTASLPLPGDDAGARETATPPLPRLSAADAAAGAPAARPARPAKSPTARTATSKKRAPRTPRRAASTPVPRDLQPVPGIQAAVPALPGEGGEALMHAIRAIKADTVQGILCPAFGSTFEHGFEFFLRDRYRLAALGQLGCVHFCSPDLRNSFGIGGTALALDLGGVALGTEAVLNTLDAPVGWDAWAQEKGQSAFGRQARITRLPGDPGENSRENNT